MTRIDILLGYLLCINLFTFIIRGIDKYKAKAQQRRISEANLLRFTGLGGWIGAILGMQAFRHKTIKSSFLIRFRLIVAVWIVISVLLMRHLF